MKLSFLPLALWCAASIARAQGEARAEDLPRAFRSLAGVELNRDSALSIRARLGAAPVSEAGSGHDTYLAWCYRGRVRDSAVTLELMSDDSDMGTRGHALNVIRLRAGRSATQSKCATLAANRSLATPGGLRLGLRRVDVERLLGRPTRRSRDSLIFEFSSKEYMDRASPEYRAWNTPERRKECFAGGEPYANVGASATMLLDHDHVIEIRLERYDQSTC